MLGQLGGINIIESWAATEPKMRLNKDLMVSKEFRIQQDLWLANFFGHSPAAYMLGPSTMVVHPTLARKLGEYR